MGDTMKKVFGSITALVLTTVLVGACGSGSYDADDKTSNDISGTLKEWSVEVDATSAKAGEVEFSIKNEGTIGHEFLVVKTDIADGEIPLVGDRFEEPSEGIEVIDEIGEYPAGETKELKLTLDSGNYQLVCNLAGHYEAGMHTTFTVID